MQWQVLRQDPVSQAFITSFTFKLSSMLLTLSSGAEKNPNHTIFPSNMGMLFESDFWFLQNKKKKKNPE